MTRLILDSCASVTASTESSPDTPVSVKEIFDLQQATAHLQWLADGLEQVEAERQRLWADIQAIVAVAAANKRGKQRPLTEAKWMKYAKQSLSKLGKLASSLNHQRNKAALVSFIEEVRRYSFSSRPSLSSCRNLNAAFAVSAMSESHYIAERQKIRDQCAKNTRQVEILQERVRRRHASTTLGGHAHSYASWLSSEASGSSSEQEEIHHSAASTRSSLDSIVSEDGGLTSAVETDPLSLVEEKKALTQAIENIIVSYLMTRNLYLSRKSVDANVWLGVYLARCEGAKNGIGVRYNKARLTTLETLHNAAHDSNATVETLRAAVSTALADTVKDHAENSFFKRRRSSLVHQLEEAMRVEPIAVARM